MSYDTYYSAEVLGPENKVETFYLDVKSSKLKVGSYMTDYDWKELFICGGISASWYDYHEDMQALAKLYPDLTFILDGEGEESCDVWRNMYRGNEFKTWHMPEPTPPKTWEEM